MDSKRKTVPFTRRNGNVTKGKETFEELRANVIGKLIQFNVPVRRRYSEDDSWKMAVGMYHIWVAERVEDEQNFVLQYLDNGRVWEALFLSVDEFREAMLIKEPRT